MSLNRSENTLVITDTSCLIILSKIGMLDVLHQLFSHIITTPEIEAEYGELLPDWIDILSVRDKRFQQELAFIVDAGEASAIALAHEIENNFLIIDDLDARKLASKYKLKVIGSLGILIRAKENGFIDLIEPFIQKMKQTNFRCSENLYQTALKKAGEA